jgi:hypothetical protein
MVQTHCLRYLEQGFVVCNVEYRLAEVAPAPAAVSDVLESEIGFHLLLCEKVVSGRTLPFSKAEARIKQLIDERNRKNCQKAFLKQLQDRNKGTQS